MTTIASAFVHHIKKLGVTHVFGIPGKSIVPLLIECEKQSIPFILSRHESGAGFQASGYAIKNQTIGVAIGTSGPGGTNLITAAGQAKAFHLPVLFITGHPSMKHTGRALAQDSTAFGTDMVKLFEPVTKFSARVERSDVFPMYFRHALEQSLTGVKGPVHLSIPLDVLLEETVPFDIFAPRTSFPLTSTGISDALPIIEQAKRPVMILGKGVHAALAYEEVRTLAETWGIPVVTTPGGKGTFPTLHPLSLNSFGLGGTQQAETYLRSGVDLILVIGSRLNDMSTAGFTEDMYPKHVIHFDYESHYIQKSLPVPTCFIQGDIKQNIHELVKAASPEQKTQYENAFLQVAVTREVEIPQPRSEIGTDYPFISAVEAVRTLRVALPMDAVVFGDEGSHSFYAIQNFDIYKPGTFFFDAAFGTMGYSLSYAIGAKVASPSDTIACLCGDGSLFMHGTEISTAVNQNIAVLFIVLNNSRLDMVDKGMSSHFGRSIGSIYDTGVHVQKFAESLGAKAFRCQTSEEIMSSVHQAMAHNGPSVIEIMVDPHEVPPTLLRG
ncbi:acetolactate synthase [Aneurinibacillus migulanus]|uniref:thiamine pyrophosphate-binding protein n=1 Tax=Aneurinibacillus migulanus TaxID=47500 RepID=UPI0005BE7A8D|nr:thiamine pyrophosphate-binding protein [Aneurinibacillus migulanus]KIV50870.1 acetolactate synthase [Aneurinibacillus migulanus]KPD09613.1 acetolactate synthase [Aneurinibacillus migulanus]CEH31619.1 Thiamine pyrophosphate enzyme, TPP binding domain protein [Aneurinibacillus migulanus]